MKRRDALAALGALSLGACSRRKPETLTSQDSPGTSGRSTARMPVLFAADGAPVLLEDAARVGELAAWAKPVPRPSAILAVSAHWEARPLFLGATRPVPLVYDFYGFPKRCHETKYPPRTRSAAWTPTPSSTFRKRLPPPASPFRPGSTTPPSSSPPAPPRASAG